jgi:hypothetical protein
MLRSSIISLLDQVAVEGGAAGAAGTVAADWGEQGHTLMGNIHTSQQFCIGKVHNWRAYGIILMFITAVKC